MKQYTLVAVRKRPLLPKSRYDDPGKCRTCGKDPDCKVHAFSEYCKWQSTAFWYCGNQHRIIYFLIQGEMIFTYCIDKTVELFFNMYLKYMRRGRIAEYEDDSEYAPSGCVSFLTIHQSKGTEFPVVVIGSLSGTPRVKHDPLPEKVENSYYRRPA